MTINQIASNQMGPAMNRLASGFRINSAADDAAGLAIRENMTSQIRGLDQGIRNTADMQSLINTAEGGLDTISDSLNRIRELSVQGLNGTLTDGQRAMINMEISQLADGIEDSTRNVQFNSMNLLDGSVQNANTASSPDGTGAIVNINDMSGIARAITAVAAGNGFDLDVIDSAATRVTSERATLGALHNRMDYTMSANSVSSLNLVDARSRIADADMAREAMNLEQDRMLNEVQILLQQRMQARAEEEAQRVTAFGM